MKIDVKITGDKEIAARLKALAKQSTSALKRAVTQSSIHVEGEAKSRAPVKTGRLRSSITHEIIDNESNITGQIGTNVEYAPHVEFGTIKAKAKPFLVPALLESKDRIISFIKKAFEGLK